MSKGGREIFKEGERGGIAGEKKEREVGKREGKGLKERGQVRRESDDVGDKGGHRSVG